MNNGQIIELNRITKHKNIELLQYKKQNKT